MYTLQTRFQPPRPIPSKATSKRWHGYTLWKGFVKWAHIQRHAYAGLETLFYLSSDILCSLKKTRKDLKTVVWRLWECEGGIKVSLPQCQITQGSGWPCRLSVSVHQQIPMRKTRTEDHPDSRLKQQFVFHQSWHKAFEVRFHKSITHTVQCSLCATDSLGMSILFCSPIELKQWRQELSSV